MSKEKKTTSGQAYINFVKGLKEAEKGISDDLFKIDETSRDVEKQAGRGRTLGSLLGAFLGSLVMPGIGTAIGAGFGSRGGSEAGEFLAKSKRGAKTSISKKDYLFRKDYVETKDRDIENMWEDFDEGQLYAALGDALTAYIMAPEISKGAEFAKVVPGVVKEYGISPTLFDMLKTTWKDTKPTFTHATGDAYKRLVASGVIG